ncbi:MAG TPA: D-2-hydroxyacid dehydrogenase [Chloroflexota bacterium]|nr:D-2-hydroxyacid dehydrogenase [Chloroflexota bacterium]
MVTAPRALPPRAELTIGFAHVAYQLDTTFAARGTALRHLMIRTPEELEARMPELDILVISGLWRNELLARADRLRWIQSIGAGYDQFPLDELRRRGIRLSSARGVNRNAVSEHAMALLLALARKLPEARDNQQRHFWRGMIPEIARREDELGGKTLGIIGLGHIGSRTAALAKAFGMRVIATKRNPATYDGPADEVWPSDRVPDLLRQSDFVVLHCPLTDETRGLIDAAALELMAPTAYLINVARGGCVDEPALLEALRRGIIAGAAIDHFWDEPLPTGSPFWDLPNVLITPHTAGETRQYESNVIDILLENLARLERGESELFNQVI